MCERAEFPAAVNTSRCFSFKPPNEEHGAEGGAAGMERSWNMWIYRPLSCSSTGFYMFITSGSRGPTCLQRRGRRLHVCCQDGRINTWTSRRCCHRPTVCRWKQKKKKRLRDADMVPLRLVILGCEWSAFCFLLWHLFFGPVQKLSKCT